jgi:hypothetical protein
MLGIPKKRSGLVFGTITERKLLKRIKALCRQCKFENPNQYKLHSFRHHFASLCANHHVAHRKALAWLGHSSSDILDLYYHLHDEDSQQAMMALANSTVVDGRFGAQDSPFEGNLRAIGESKIEKLLQVPDFKELTDVLFEKTERGGFEPPVLLRAHWFSKPARSAAPTPLRIRLLQHGPIAMPPNLC